MKKCTELAVVKHYGVKWACQLKVYYKTFEMCKSLVSFIRSSDLIEITVSFAIQSKRFPGKASIHGKRWCKRDDSYNYTHSHTLNHQHAIVTERNTKRRKQQKVRGIWGCVRLCCENKHRLNQRCVRMTKLNLGSRTVDIQGTAFYLFCSQA